jgi:hypothetical protein
VNKNSVLTNCTAYQGTTDLPLDGHINYLCKDLIVLSQDKPSLDTCTDMVKSHILKGLMLIPYLINLLLKSRAEKEEKILKLYNASNRTKITV